MKNNQASKRNPNMKFDGDHDFLVFKSDSESDLFTVIPICTDYVHQKEKLEAAFHQKMVVLEKNTSNCVMFESNVYRTETLAKNTTDFELPDEGVSLRTENCTFYKTMEDGLLTDSGPFSMKVGQDFLWFKNFFV